MTIPDRIGKRFRSPGIPRSNRPASRGHAWLPGDRHRARPAVRSRGGTVVAPSLILSLALSAFLLPVSASHRTITANDATFDERGQGFNGYRVYLSAPTHIDSGSRGELGWEENINGRHWNNYAAIGNYVGGEISTSQYRSLTSRGYKVTVSQNDRAGQFIANRNNSDNWGADVHIVTHTNAGRGDYLLVLIDDATNTAGDRTLRSELVARLGPVTPGSEVEATDNSGYTGNLAELRAAAPYNAYVELIFHDNQAHVDWLGSGNDWGRAVKVHPWRYGWAVDRTLGYPRN